MMSTRTMLIAWFVGLAVVAASGGASNAYGQEPQRLCGNAINHVATREGVPAVLMRAIALTESGRWDAGQAASVAWPWTVTAEGKGHFLPSKAKAIAKVRALQARGVSNIDVGCMQINLHFHPEAFSDLEAAFDPVRNTTYAAGFLSKLKAKTGAWWPAVGRYHSATPKLANYYQSKVAARLGAGKTATVAVLPLIPGANDAADAAALLAQQQEAAVAAARRDTAEARRQAVIAAYLARRVARRENAS